MYLRRAITTAAVATAVVPVLLLTAGLARADTTPDSAEPATLHGCTEVSNIYGDYHQNSLRATLQGMSEPYRVVAGDGWHTVTGSLHNIGRTTLPLVEASALVFRVNDGDVVGDPVLGSYVLVEVQSGSGLWERLGDGSDGQVGTLHNLAPGATGSFHLRFRFSADTPKSMPDGSVVFRGSFPDRYTFPDTGKTVDCNASTTIIETIYIKQPASTSTPTASATSAPTGSASASPTAGPPGTTTTSAPGPQLAATGSGSALPVLTSLGAAAAAAGAGAMTLTRRRRTHH